MAEAADQSALSAAGSLVDSDGWILVPTMSCGFLKVRDKLRKDHFYKEVVEDKLVELAKALSDEAKMKEEFFSHLLQPNRDSIQEAMEEAWEFPEGSYLTSQESKEATERAEGRFATVCSLPLKLVLTKIGEGDDRGSDKGVTSSAVANSKTGATLASYFKFPFGALHAALMIGDILLEWNTSSLVIPKRKEVTPIFQASLDRFSLWNRFTSRYKSHMRQASGQGKLDFNTQVEVMLIIGREKETIVDNLIREIVGYNTERQYSLRDCNCQHFIVHILKPIRVFEFPNFTGRLKRCFDNLRKGQSATARTEFRTHKDLDEYARSKLKTMEPEEADCLRCIYTAFHRQAGMNDLTQWQCHTQGCQMARLEELVDTKRLLQHKFTDP